MDFLDDLRADDARGIGAEGFLILQHIEPHPADVPTFQTGEQGVDINQRTSRGVDEDATGFAAGQTPRAQHMARPHIERNMQCHHIGMAQQGIQRNITEPGLRGPFLVGVAVEG